MGSRTSPPPDRLAAVLGEVERARRTAWLPDERAVTDRAPRRAARRDGEDETPAEGPRAARRRARENDAQLDVIRPHAPLARRPRSLDGAGVAPGRLAVLAVCVLVVAAAVVLGGRLLYLRATSQPQPLSAPTSGLPEGADRSGGTDRASTGDSTRRGAGPGAAAPAGSPAGVAASATTPSVVAPVVHVVGQVEHPGVVRLSPGARVADAVRQAGGVTEKADLTRVNLARPVQDGEQIQVPRPGEAMSAAPTPTAPPGPAGGAGTAPTGASPSGSAGGAASGSAGVVNINTADASALTELPGIGEKIAARIVEWRTTNGRFATVDDLGEVSGIGDKMLAKLRPHVTV